MPLSWKAQQRDFSPKLLQNAISFSPGANKVLKQSFWAALHTVKIQAICQEMKVDARRQSVISAVPCLSFSYLLAFSGATEQQALNLFKKQSTQKLQPKYEQEVLDSNVSKNTFMEHQHHKTTGKHVALGSNKFGNYDGIPLWDLQVQSHCIGCEKTIKLCLTQCSQILFD